MIETGIDDRLVKFYGFSAVFSDTSLIFIYDKNDKLVLQLEPRDLSSLYGAYQQLIKEENNEKI